MYLIVVYTSIGFKELIFLHVRKLYKQRHVPLFIYIILTPWPQYPIRYYYSNKLFRPQIWRKLFLFLRKGRRDSNLFIMNLRSDTVLILVIFMGEGGNADAYVWWLIILTWRGLRNFYMFYVKSEMCFTYWY